MATNKTHIARPFLDEQQLALLDAGFPVEVNRNIEMSEGTQKIIREHVDMMLEMQAELGAEKALEYILEMSSLENSKTPKNSHSKPLPPKKTASNGNCETKRVRQNSKKPKELSAVESEFNNRFNEAFTTETAPF